jgi:hypothetical protein
LIAVLGVALEVFRGETFPQPSFPGELLANERRRQEAALVCVQKLLARNL